MRPAAGPPLLLLQGSGANAAMWIRDVELLATRHRVYAVDVVATMLEFLTSEPAIAESSGRAKHSLWRL